MTVSCTNAGEPSVVAIKHRPRGDLGGQSPSMQSQLARVQQLMHHCLSNTGQGPAQQASEYQITTGGSLLRARLALISTEAFDCPLDYRIASAAACELIHNASLVHDDLCDGDPVRRNRATVWKRYGKDVALCSGDLLLCAAFNASCHVDDARQARELTRLVAQLTSEVIIGQSLEVAPNSGKDNPGLRQYLQATRAKTVPLIRLPLAAGALLIPDNHQAQVAIDQLAGAMGLAYQIVDDLDDLLLARPNLHAFHAWHHHRTPGCDSRAVRLHRASRHALAALQRAGHELKVLALLAPGPVEEQLAPLIEKLRARALEHRRSANDNRERIADAPAKFSTE